MDVIVATGNKGKLKEFKKMLSDHFDNVYSVKDFGLDVDVEENGENFEQNVLIKANYIKEKTDFAVIADDSGLEVDALCGAPGLYSARYAGENATDQENRSKLFKEMQGVEDRSAHFVSVVALIMPDGKVYTGRGETKGYIMDHEEGTNGFGYDVMFFSHELGKSFGVATEEEKNSVSHRAKAIKSLLKCLPRI